MKRAIQPWKQEKEITTMKRTRVRLPPPRERPPAIQELFAREI